MSKRRSIRTRLRQIVLLPFAVLLVGVVASLFFANRAERVVARDAQSDADHSAETVDFLTRGRVNTYSDVLLTLRSFYSGSDAVDRGEFQTFVRSLQVLDQYPGIQSLQYVRSVQADEISGFESDVRNDTTLRDAGHPEFSVGPSSRSSEAYVIEFVEPIALNEQIMGLDIGSSIQFRNYVERARDTGGLIASAPFTLLPGEEESIESPHAVRFYLMLAVYEGSEAPGTVLERRQQFRGVVAGLFEPPEMLTSALPSLPVAIEIWDSSTRDVSGSSGLVYRGDAQDGQDLEVELPANFEDSATLQAQIPIGDRWWDMRVASLPGSLGTAANGMPTAVLVAGLFVTLLLSALVLVVVNSRYHAQIIARDMTKNLRASEARAHGIVHNAGDAIVSVRQDGTVASFNSAAVRMFQWPADEILGEHVTKLVALDQLDVHESFRRAVSDEVSPADWSSVLDVEAMRRDGTTFSAHLTVGMVEEVGVRTAVWILRDVSDQVELQERLSYQARHDALTGLANRAAIQEGIGAALKRRGRTHAGMAVLFLDLDRFKNVNDSMGHEVGDKLLVAVAGRLRSTLRGSDLLGRVGGDEFVLVAEQLDSPEGALTLAERLVSLVSQPFSLDGKEVIVGASVGVACASRGDASPESLLAQSDTAMYKAKERGSNMVQMFDLSMQADSDRRLDLERGLRGAVQQNELVLHYQPVLNTDDGAIAGFEALVRWQRPGFGLVAPAEFIPVAEECGVILEVGEWVLNEACRQISAWEDVGRAVQISVNISGRQLTQDGLVHQIAEALRVHRTSPELLVLEITESFLLEDAEAAARVLMRLKNLGLRLAIDDFGTGYSSLTYLTRFPVDILKIDRSFVSRLGASAEDESIIEMIINLSHTLGLGVVAEGVENSAQFEVLRALGANYTQGFYFAKPMPVAEVDVWRERYERGSASISACV